MITLWPRRGLHDADLDRMEFFGKDIRSFIWMPVPSPSRRKILSLDSFFELDLLKKEIGHQSPQPCVLELEFSNSVAAGGHPIGRARVVGCDERKLRPRRRLAPPVQGHNAHAKRARNFALQFPARR